MTDITPSDEQNKAIREFREWYFNSPEPFFYLAGYAGSGKTSIMKLMIEQCGLDPDNNTDVRYASYTGKAASVMQRKGMSNASTIHRLIYKVESDLETQKLLCFLNTEDSPMLNAKLAAIDEVSMVNTQMGQDLLSYNRKILVLGDPGQLKPIEGAGFFTQKKPNFFLREIHRQALDNPIIRVSKDIREGKNIDFCDYGNFRKVRIEDVSDDEFLNSDQIITGKHVSRREINNMMLELNDFDTDFPTKPGIKLICTKNNSRNGLLNGLIGYTNSERPPEDVNPDAHYMFQDVKIPDTNTNTCYNNLSIYTGYMEDHWRIRPKTEVKMDWEMCRRFDVFDFGYAITTHKSQGSQWDNVYLYDDGFGSWNAEDRIRWLYTGVTRAAENMTIVV